MENTNIERPNTVAGLLEKRAQLAGKLKYLRAEERKVICDLDHIDAAKGDGRKQFNTKRRSIVTLASAARVAAPAPGWCRQRRPLIPASNGR